MNHFLLKSLSVLTFSLFAYSGFSQCVTPYTIDWDTYPVGTDPRGLTYTSADVDVTIESIDLYGHVAVFEIVNTLQATNSIGWQQTIDNSNEFALATFKFSKPVRDFNFTIFDVDEGIFDDYLTINGFSDGSLVTLSAGDVRKSQGIYFYRSNQIYERISVKSQLVVTTKEN